MSVTGRNDPLIGQTVGDYKVTGFIGEGGMGVVFAAEHLGLKRKAAFKVLRKELVSDPQEAERFMAEAQVVSRIGHPNIIDVFDIGELPDGRVYYVMELLQGRSLTELMKERRLGFHDFLPIVRQTLEGLEAAHSLNIVHRDLKPDNLFLIERAGESAVVKILDFGVAKVLGDESAESKLTRTGNIVGTPQYMSPEQIDGSHGIDRRSDVYAMGVILYELATGRLPFQAETVGQMLKAHLLEEAPAFQKFPQGQLAEGVPAELEAVIFKALAKAPADRYASAKELEEDLDRVAAGMPTVASGWMKEQAEKRDSLIRTQGIQAALLTQGGTLSLPGAQTRVGTIASTVATTLLVGPQARKWQALTVGIVVTVLVLIAGGGAILWKRSADLRKAQQQLLAEKRRQQQREREEEERKKKKVDLMDLRSKALAVLQEGLKEGDPGLRIRALVGLAQSKDTRHRSLIEPLLGDPDTVVKLQAVSALGQLGARSAVPALTALVGEKGDTKDLALAVAVAEALDKLGDPLGTTIFKRALKAKDPQAQLRAALALAEKGDKAANKIVQKRLKRKGVPEEEIISIQGRLARAGDAEAQRSLKARLEGGLPPELKLGIANSLARAGDESGRSYIAQEARAEGPRQLLAARLLASLDDPSGYDLFRAAFSDAKRPLPERVVAAEGLGACGEKAGAKLLAMALPKEAAEGALRQSAAAAILQIAGGDPQLLAQQSLSWAQTALTDSDWTVREAAVALLGDSDPNVAVPLLGKAIKDGQAEVRQSAAKALGRTKVRAAVAVLASALDDSAGGVRLTALRSIGQVGSHLRQRGEKAVDDDVAEKLKTALISRADSGEAGEQVVAAATLLRLGDESRKAKLKEGLGSEDPEVRKLAVEESAADPETAKDALQTALKDPSFPVRFRAARELADQGKKDGVPVLKEGLGRGGADGLIAYGALKKLGESAAPPAGLEAVLKSGKEPERLAVIEASAQMPAAEAVALLRIGARDRAAAVRRKVVEVAGDLQASAGEPAPGLPVLKLMLNDSDVGIRSRAGALVARLSPREEPKPQPAPEPKEAPKTAPVVAAPDLSQPPPPDLSQPPDLTRPPPPDLAPVQKAPDPAQAKVGEGAPAEAAPVLKQKELSREEATVLTTKAELLLQTGKFDKAAAEFEKIRKLDARQPVYFQMGEAYRKWADQESNLAKQKKLIQKAIDAYKRAKDPRAKAYLEELRERLTG